LKTAVVVVHGVGDPKDGDALAGLMAGLRDSGYRQVRAAEVEHRVQPGDRAAGGSQVATYPVHRATMAPEDTREDGSHVAGTLELHEVYWGDLSRVKGSAAGLLLGLFDLVFGLRHVAEAAALDAQATSGEERGLCRHATRWAGRAAWAAEQMARGPMLALNLLLAGVALSQWLLGRLPGHPLGEPAAAASFLAPVVMSLAAWRLKPALRHRQWSLQTLNWLLGVSLAALALAGLLRGSPGHQPFLEAITTGMSIGAFVMALAAVSMMLLSLWAVWLLWLRRPDVPAAERHALPHRRLARALVAMNFSTAFGVGLFVLLVMVAWTALGMQMDEDLKARVIQGLHLFVLVWGAFLAAALTFMGIAWVNGRLTAAGSHRPRQRYIAHPAVCVVFLGLSLLYAALFLPMSVHIETQAWCEHGMAHDPGLAALRQAVTAQCLQGVPWWPALDRMVQQYIVPFEHAKTWAVGLTLVLLGFGAAMQVHALQALDVLLDVVAHFRTGLAAREGAGPPRPTHPTWEAITDRFVDVLTHVGHVQRVVVVTHSQGTTVALHALGVLEVSGRPARARPLEGLRCDLVTLGSPADHLYRHYMPRTYRPGRQPTWVRRWLNIYRRDDYIGTVLDFGRARWPANQPVGPRGHGDYWRDREVLQHLVPFLRHGTLPP